MIGQVEEKIRTYLEEIILDQADIFVVKVLISGKKGDQILRITLDGDNGIAIDQCASISRQLAKKIEEADLIEDKFRLEVSSAGLETPLLMERQYAKNLGRQLKVTLLSGEIIEGELMGNSKEGLEIEVGEKNQKIAFKEINNSVIKISFK